MLGSAFPSDRKPYSSTSENGHLRRGACTLSSVGPHLWPTNSFHLALWRGAGAQSAFNLHYWGPPRAQPVLGTYGGQARMTTVAGAADPQGLRLMGEADV